MLAEGSNANAGPGRSRLFSRLLRELPPLRISLPALFLLTALICGLTALALTFSAERKLVGREFRNHAGFLANFVLAQIERDLRAGDMHSLQRSVQQLNFDRNLHYAVLLDGENAVLETTELARETKLDEEKLVVVDEARRSVSGFAQRIVDGHLLLTASESGQPWNREEEEADDASRQAPVLLLEHDLRRVRGENRTALLAVVMISIFPILLSALLFGLVVRMIVVDRMDGLVKQFGRIMGKAGPTGEPLPGRDEFSLLSRRIETMAEEMEETTGALAASEERLSFALRGSNDGLWDWDLRTDEVYYSPRWKSMLGYEDSELANTLDTWKDLLHPAERDRVLQEVEEFLRPRNSRDSFQMEFRFREKGGGYRDILSRAFLIEKEGKPVRLVGTHVDVTELKQARHDLRLARFALETAPEKVFLIDADGKILYANRTAQERLGFSIEEMRTLHFSDIDLRNRRDDWGLDFSRFREAGVLTLESEHRTVDGRVYPVDLSVSHGVFEGKEYLCAFSRDATERKLAEKHIRDLNENLEAKVEQRTLELNEANRALESFAYTVSHDLRAPLRGVNGFAEALETDYAENLPEQARGYLERIRNAAQTMSGMINSLLELSRISRDTVERREIDLAGIATEIAAEFRTIDPDRSVSVTIEPEMTVSGDEGLVRALLHNLIGNSWKFTAGVENAKISFYSEEKEGDRVFVVEDNGVGFHIEDPESLFQPFTRYHRQSEFEGEGIGLATVKRIVERHGGWVRIESEIGKGTTVRFVIGDREN